LSKLVGIINNRCEKIYGLDNDLPVIQAHRGRIVSAIKAHHDGIICLHFKITQNLGQVTRTDLTCSTGAVAQCGKPYFISIIHIKNLIE
jgi:hypothetical protein